MRIALHTGECVERSDDYFGPPVNRIARLVASAHGGQTVVSRVTADLVRDGLPTGATLQNLGVLRLKGLGQPEQVFGLHVGWSAQRVSRPRARPARRRRHACRADEAHRARHAGH